MSEFERVKKAMQMVAQHKFPSRELREEDFDILAETVIKTIWLIDKEQQAKKCNTGEEA